MNNLKLGRYVFEKTDDGFTVYTEVKDYYDLDGVTPMKERRYRLYFNRAEWDNNKLYWSLYKCYPQLTHVDGDKSPKTIARFASQVCEGVTIYEF